MQSGSEAPVATVGWDGYQGAGQLYPYQRRRCETGSWLVGVQLACALAPEDRRTCLSWHAVCWLPLLACRIPLIRPGTPGHPPGVALLYTTACGAARAARL